MESLTKPHISREHIDALCQAHLGATPKHVKELKDGWFNAAFLLSLPDGGEFVLKVAPPPGVKLLRYEADILRAEVEAMRSVQGLVPVPKIVAYDSSCQAVASPFFIMERLHGVPYNHIRESLSEDQQSGVEQQVGQIVRAYARPGANGFGMWNGPHFPSWRQAFEHLVSDLRRDAEEADVDLPAGAWAAFEPHLGAMEAVAIPHLVHWDLWEGNVFVDETTLQVTGVIDFERALWGDPLMEMNFFMRRPGFLEGYGTDPEATPTGPSRRFAYTLYLMLVMVIESKYRGFTAEHEAWPREQLAGLLERG